MAVFICLLLAAPSVARTITVDNEGPADFNNIQAAINDANNGDTVEIQPGTYTGQGNRDIDFLGKAITVRSTDPNDPNIVAATVIDCNATRDDPHRAFHFHSGEDANSVLDGLTFTRAYGSSGAAINFEDSGAKITNCTITKNSAERGVTIGCTATATPSKTVIISNCRITDNDASAIGGCNVMISNCVLSYNRGYGLANGSGSIAKCTISGNESSGITGFAGDISDCVITGNSNTGIFDLSDGKIAGCIIMNNLGFTSRGDERTGGIICKGDVTIASCIIAHNTGGIFYSEGSPTITNCVIAENFGSKGDGISCSTNASAIINNCTIAANSASGILCQRGRATLTNSIVWGNSADSGANITLSHLGTLTVSHSDVQGGPNDVYTATGCTLNWGAGNIDNDPWLTGDHHLLPGSPCIDAADPCYVPIGEVDIDAEQRPYPPRLDMGADEFIDTDGDDLPDFWEQKYFGSPVAAEPNANPENDNWTNIEEYYLGYDPIKPPDFYVDPIEGNDNWDGWTPSWDGRHGPKRTIQAAVDICSIGHVILAPGTYTGPGNRDIDPKGKPITIRSTDPNDPAVVAATIIDCQGSESEPHRGFYFHTNENPDCTVAGLTITGGNVEHSSPPSKPFGGAIYCNWWGSATITSCTITGNRANVGAGIFGAKVTINKCTIANNQAGYSGGGGWTPLAQINESIITGNTAEHTGGGLCVGSGAIISDCAIMGNRATVGGAIHGDTGTPTLLNCTISGNHADGYYGSALAYFQGPIINCTITGNSVGYLSGGALYECSGPITNCTIVGNLGAGLYKCEALVLNSIIWNNSRHQIVGFDPRSNRDTRAAYCDIQGGWLDDDNINADPCFVEPGHWEDPCNTPLDSTDDLWIEGDYHLKSRFGRWDPNSQMWIYDDVTSLCVDAGDPNSDWTKELWPHGKRINMGAYGGTPQASMSPSNAGNIADLDFDDFAYRTDLRLFFSQWLITGILLPADFTRDRVVNFPDFAILCSNWKHPTSPSPAAYPNPPSGSIGIRLDPILSWQPGDGATSHDVYFGTSDPPALQGNQTGTTYEPQGPLSTSRIYYWRINEVNPYGTAVGPVWSFGTTSGGPR